MNQFIPFTTVAFVSALLTVLARWIAIRFTILDSPKTHSSHRKATPLLGGVAVAVSALLGWYFFAQDVLRASLVFATIAIVLLGFWDDISTRFSPYLKLMVQLVIAGWLIYNGYVFDLSEMPWLNVLVTLAWIIFITNAFNLLDNMNGLSCGIAVIIFLTLATLAVHFNLPELATVGIVISGAGFGFLFFNYPKARIFLGDAGSLFFGLMAAIFSILLFENLQLSSPLPSYFALLCIFFIPIFDTLTVIVIRRSDGKSIFIGDQNHLSHQLVKRGFSRATVVLILWGIATVVCTVGVLILLN